MDFFSRASSKKKEAKEPYDWNPNVDHVTKYFVDPMRPTKTKFQSSKLELSDTISGWLACFFLMIPLFASTSFYLWKDSDTPSGVGVFPKTSILTDMWTEESTKRATKTGNARRNVPGIDAITTEEATEVPRIMVISFGLWSVTILGALIAAMLFCRAMRKHHHLYLSTKATAKSMLWFLRPAPPLCLGVVSFLWVKILYGISRKELTVGNALWVAVAGVAFNLAWFVIRFWRTWKIYRWIQPSDGFHDAPETL